MTPADFGNPSYPPSDSERGGKNAGLMWPFIYMNLCMCLHCLLQHVIALLSSYHIRYATCLSVLSSYDIRYVSCSSVEIHFVAIPIVFSKLWNWLFMNKALQNTAVSIGYHFTKLNMVYHSLILSQISHNLFVYLYTGILHFPIEGL